jgi:hypothetical protein
MTISSLATAIVFLSLGTEAHPQVLAITSEGQESYALVATLREVSPSVDIRSGAQGLPSPREMRASWQTVVIPSDAGLHQDETWKLAEYARLGGGVLMLSHGRWDEYAGTPLEMLAPTFLAYEQPTHHPVRVAHVAEHPAVAGGEWPRQSPVLPRAGIRTADDPRFARPKTPELKRFHKPLLSRRWTVLLAGDDPARTPLMVAGLYGAGRVVVSAFPMHAFRGEPGASHAFGQLLGWLAAGTPVAETRLPSVAAAGVPGGSLVDGMGFSVHRGVQASWSAFDAVVCGRELSEESAQQVLRYVRQGGTLILTGPGLLRGPLAELSSLGAKEPPWPEPEAITWTRDGVPLEVPDGYLLPPWSGETRLRGSFNASGDLASRTALLRWGRGETSSLVLGNVGIHCLSVNGQPAELGQDGACSLTGLLKPGPNAVEFWAWGDGFHGLLLPRLEAGAAGRLAFPNGWVTRQCFSGERWTASSGETVWRWDDGSPALVRSPWGAGTVWWITAPILDELVDPREHGYGEGRSGKRRFFRETTSNLLSLAVHYALYGEEGVPKVEPIPDKRQVRISLPSGEGGIVWRLYNWQRSLLGQGEGEQECTVPLPDRSDSLVYEATTYRDHYWLETGVLTPSGASLLSWMERWVRPPARATVAILMPSVAERSKGPFVTFPRREDVPTEWTERAVVEFPLYAPGEQIEATVVCSSPSDLAASLNVSATFPLSGEKVSLLDEPVMLAAGVPQSFTVHTHTAQGFAPGRLRAELRGPEASHAVAAKTFYVVQPWRGLRSVLEVRSRGMQVMGSLYDQSDAEDFAASNLLADPPRGLYWGPFAATYPGQPWCNWHPHPYGLFPNGRYYRDWLKPQIQGMAETYRAGPEYAVSASLVDGFNGVPDPEGCFFPQNLYAYAQWMEARGELIEAETVGELVETIRWQHFDTWSHFIAAESALRSHEIYREHLVELSPWSDVTDQCDLPLLHQILRVPELDLLAPRWERVFSLSSTDAWNVQVGRGYHSPTYTQMVAKAISPALPVGHYHMEMLGGDGVELISLAERMRRQNYDTFWMMVLDREGHYRPLQDYFDGGGVSWLGGWRQWLRVCAGGDRGGNVDTDHDWCALTHAYALMEAIGPEAPLGGCWLTGTARYEPGGYDAEFSLGDGAILFSLLRDNGVSIPAVCGLGNAGNLQDVDGAILVPPAFVGDRNVEALRRLLRDGKGLALVQTTGRGLHAESPLDGDFGLRHLGSKEGQYQVLDHPLGEADQGVRGSTRSAYGADRAQAVVRLTAPKQGRGEDDEPRVAISARPVGSGRAAFWSGGALKGPFAAGSGVDHTLARTFARAVNWALKEPVVFEAGSAGYAFTARGLTFIVVEELTGRGRVVRVGLRSDGGGHPRCVDLNGNTRLMCRHDGEYVWIDVPLRPSGAALVAVSY